MPNLVLKLPNLGLNAKFGGILPNLGLNATKFGRRMFVSTTATTTAAAAAENAFLTVLLCG
jgi:hypothetical protein